MLISIWSLTSFSILTAALLVVFTGALGYPYAVEKLSNATDTWSYDSTDYVTTYLTYICFS